MLIVDIPRSEGSDKLLRIGVIGSCRARDLFYEAYKLDPKPPESIGAPECSLVWYRFSAFTHSILQALQYQRFVSGRLEIPAELQPFLLFYSVTPAVQKRLSTLTAQLINSIDLYVVELSTLSDFSVGQYSFNSSYAETNLVRAGGKPLLKWWRSAANPENDHQAIVQETLNALPSKNIQDTEVMRSVIAKGKWHTQSLDESAASLCLLMNELGKPIVIVPACNTPDAPSENREKLIDNLEKLSVQEGCHFFDPTLVIADAGQINALKGGVDTMHYEQGFHYSLLKAVVPFLQQAVSLHKQTGEFSVQRYEPHQTLRNNAA